MSGDTSVSTHTSIILIAITGLLFSGLLGVSFAQAQEGENCTLDITFPSDVFDYAQDGTIEFGSFEKNNGNAAITITNNSDCDLPLTLASYEMTSSGVLTDQNLYSDTSLTIQPESTETISTSLPSCMSQLDLLLDPDQNGAPDHPSFANPELIGYTYSGNEEDIFAENDIFHFTESSSYSELDEYPNDGDDRPENAQPADGFYFCDATTLTIKKIVNNTDGSDIAPSDFTISATPHKGNSPSYSFPGSESGATRNVAGIRYNLDESGPDGVDFTTTYSGDCQQRDDGPGGRVTPNSNNTTCTITNTIKADSDTCQHPNDRLPIQTPSDVFEYVSNGTLEFSNFQKPNGNAAITVTNNSNCKLPLALGVYEMYDNNYSDQKLFSQDQKTVSPNGGQATLESKLPSCMAQIDLLYNPDGTNPPEIPSPANPDVIGYTFNQNNKDIFAENDIFHFTEDSPYSELDNFPNDGDDRPENAGPEANFCSDEPDPQPISCPFTEGSGSGQYDEVITFSDNGVRSDRNESAAKTEQKTLSLDSGQYQVGMFARDQYVNRVNQTQQFEQYFVRFTNSATNFTQTTGSTDDLQDQVITATTSRIETITLSQPTNSIQARHSSFFDKVGDDGSANSLGVGCVAVDKQESNPTQLQIIKKVENQGGRDVHPSDFTITATPHTGNSPSYSFLGSSDGATRDVASIRYDLDETGPDNVDYSTSYSGDCTARNNSSGGKVTPSSGDTATCTITNTLEEEEDDDPLTGSCTVSPNQAETGDAITWEASASGGNSPYTYSWNLENKSNNASGQTVMTTYSNEGDFEGTVTISDENGNSVERTCSVSIEDDDDGGNGGGSGGGGGVLPPRDNDDDDDDGEVAGTQDPEFSVQCQPDQSSYLVGQKVTFTADIDGDIDTDEADFRWASTDGQNLTFDDTTASLQYTSAGEKQVGVRIDYEGESEIAKCPVTIRNAQTQSGVALDQVPYTGPGDTTRTVAFLLLLGLLAVGGGYLVVRRLRKDGVHVGIPHDHKQ